MSLSGLLHRRPGLRVGLLLTPPMLWLGVAYLGALAALFITSLWGQNSFTGEVERVWTLDNFRTLFTVDVYRTITARTLGIAALVTVVDAVVAFPVALFMAKIASVRTQRLMVIAVPVEEPPVTRRKRQHDAHRTRRADPTASPFELEVAQRSRVRVRGLPRLGEPGDSSGNAGQEGV